MELFRKNIVYVTPGGRLAGGHVGFLPNVGGAINNLTSGVSSGVNAFATGVGSGFQQTTNVALKWANPETLIGLMSAGTSAFKTVTGQGAQEQAQANLLLLEQQRAAARAASTGQLMTLVPWVVGGVAVVVLGTMFLKGR